MAGLMQDGRRRFNVMTAWGTSRSKQFDRKSALGAADDCDKMVFEGLDCTFSWISPMVSW